VLCQILPGVVVMEELHDLLNARHEAMDAIQAVIDRRHPPTTGTDLHVPSGGEDLGTTVTFARMIVAGSAPVSQSD
jgi:hypothetical protein